MVTYLIIGVGIAVMLPFGWLIVSISRDQKAIRDMRRQRVARLREARPGPGELGALVSVFPTVRARQRQVAVWATPVGGVVFGAAVGLEFLDLSGSSTTHMVPVGGFGMVAGLGFFTMVAGLSAGWRHVRRRAEEFRLYEGGIVHADARGARPIAWNAITDLTVQRYGGWAMRVLGRTLVATIKVRGGRRIVITSLTRQAPTLLDALEKAVLKGHHPH